METSWKQMAPCGTIYGTMWYYLLLSGKIWQDMIKYDHPVSPNVAGTPGNPLEKGILQHIMIDCRRVYHCNMFKDWYPLQFAQQELKIT